MSIVRALAFGPVVGVLLGLIHAMIRWPVNRDDFWIGMAGGLVTGITGCLLIAVVYS
jgi:hypothetical protein